MHVVAHSFHLCMNWHKQCTYLRMYVCMYVCMYVWAHADHVCMYVCMYVCMGTRRPWHEVQVRVSSLLSLRGIGGLNSGHQACVVCVPHMYTCAWCPQRSEVGIRSGTGVTDNCDLTCGAGNCMLLTTEPSLQCPPNIF